jgi:hypothetical protein
MSSVDNGYHNRYCRVRTRLGDKRNAAHVPVPL